MPSSTDLRRQAAHCLRIAAAVNDQGIAAALVAIADDFSAEADEIDPSLDPSLGPIGKSAVDGSRSGRFS
jgi:hypothetical protein